MDELQNIILFLSIKEEISKKYHNFSEDYIKKEFNNLSFNGDNFEENIMKMITKLTSQINKPGINDELYSVIKKEKLYQRRKNQSKEATSLLTERSDFKEEYENMKIDLARMENESLEYYIQKSLISTY